MSVASFEALADAIRSRVATLAAAISPAVPITGPNLPDLADPKGNANGIWARLTINTAPGSSIQLEFGETKTFRHQGVVVIEIFTQFETGDDEANQVADAFASDMRTITVDGVTYQAPTIRQVGRDGQWWQINVSCPFYANEIA